MNKEQNNTSPKDKAKQAAASEATQQQAPAEASKQPTLEEQIASLSAENEKLSEENQKLCKTVVRLQSSADKSDTYLNQLVAMKSDFESYKRRMKFNAEQAKAEGVQSVAVKLIDIADTFEIARSHISDEETLKAFEMIHKQLIETLGTFGVEAMDVKGKTFDHNTMNALSKMDYGAENRDKVVEVYKNGYTMGDKVIRYAQVVVGG